MDIDIKQPDTPKLTYTSGKIWICISIVLTVFIVSRLAIQYHNLETGVAKYVDLPLVEVNEDKGTTTYANDVVKTTQVLYKDIEPSQFIRVIVQNGKIHKEYHTYECIIFIISWIMVPFAFMGDKEEWVRMNRIKRN